MALQTEYIVKLLQLKGLGRKTAFQICELSDCCDIDSDLNFQNFIIECIKKKLILRLPEYTNADFSTAFKKGDKILNESYNANVMIKSFYDNDFPKSLVNIPNAPIILNFKGDYKKLNTSTGVAIIGTREPTKEGVKSGEYFGEFLGKRGFNIVSGLAKGCDSSAHIGCLNGGGVTTAILAHGLHTIYPKENVYLSDKILNNGGILLSEYFYGTGALANYFVERDRLQAGLSNATIVIQTDIKGGTMHAVNATIKSNKLLAAVKFKSDLNSAKVLGNEMLIQQGNAFALTSINVDEFISKINSIPANLNSDLVILNKNEPLSVELPNKVGKKVTKKSNKEKKKTNIDNLNLLIKFDND